VIDPFDFRRIDWSDAHCHQPWTAAGFNTGESSLSADRKAAEPALYLFEPR